jgi:hypothetical protein
MKKIAFFVEGQTEQLFINKILREIAGEKNIAINLLILRGGAKTSRMETVLPHNPKYANPSNPKYQALIYDCGGDNYDGAGKLKSEIVSDIVDMRESLLKQGYAEIIGLRDLYPMALTDLHKLEKGLQFKLLQGATTLPCSIIVAVREIEDWFLAECKHYTCIHTSLVLDATQIASLGFNPYTDDLTLRNSTAAADLHHIYQLVGKAYSKTKNNVERTVECLDYANLYLHVRHKIAKLNELISKIDHFLT